MFTLLIEDSASQSRELQIKKAQMDEKKPLSKEEAFLFY
jgi:hypothetical protein